MAWAGMYEEIDRWRSWTKLGVRILVGRRGVRYGR